MQRYSPEKKTSDILRQSLQTPILNLLNYRDELAHSKPFTYRKFIELAGLQRSLIDVESIISEADSQPLTDSLEKFKQFLNNSWSKIKSHTSNAYNTYLYAINYPQTQLRLAIAKVMHAELPNQYPNIDELMMPGVNLDKPLGTFIVNHDGTKQISFSILTTYCKELAHTPSRPQVQISNWDLNRLIHCTKEGNLLHKAAENYQSILKIYVQKELGVALLELNDGLNRGTQELNPDRTIGVAAYNAIIKFSEFFNALPLETKNYLFTVGTFKKLWEDLSTKQDLCIQTIVSDIHLIYMTHLHLGTPDAELETTADSYQQYLQLFNEHLSGNCLMWNKNFNENYEELFPQVLALLKEKKLINAMITSPTIAAYFKTLINDHEILKNMIGPELQEHIALFQQAGLSVSVIQAALLNLIHEVKFDKEFCQTLLSLGCDFQTIYQAAKRDEHKYNILEILIDLMPDKKEWLGLMHREYASFIRYNVMQCMKKSVNHKAYVQEMLQAGFDICTLVYEHSSGGRDVAESVFQLKPDYFNQQFEGKHGYTGPLMHVYFSRDNLYDIEILIQAGVPYDQVDAQGDTLLTYAAKNSNGYDKKFAKLLKLCPALINTPNKFSETPLSITVVNNNRNNVEILLQANCDVNTKHADGLTPLDLACIGQHSKIARWLVEKGASGDRQMIMKKYIYDFITVDGSKDNVVKALIKRDDLDFTLRNEQGQTPSMTAQLRGRADLAKLLLDKEQSALAVKTKKAPDVMPRRESLFAINTTDAQPQNTSVSSTSRLGLTKNH